MHSKTARIRYLSLVTVAGLALALSACGGGESKPRPISDVQSPPTNRDELRQAILDGNSVTGNSKIAQTVASHSSGDLFQDSAKVSYSWTGDDISIDIAGTNGDMKSVSLERETSLDWNQRNISNNLAAQVSIGNSRDNVHTIALTILDRYWNDATDHAAWGYWLSVNNPSLGAVDAGAFVRGTQFERDPAPHSILHQPREAYYARRGGAVGLHVVEYVESTFGGQTAIAEFSADVAVTAYFGENPRLEGEISNFQYRPPYEETVRDNSLFQSEDYFDSRHMGRRPYVVMFDSEISADGTFSSRNVDMIRDLSIYNCCLLPEGTTGVVSGEFSADLGRIGGTFRTRSDFPGGTVGQYIGAFVADHASRPRAPLRPE